MTRDQALQGFTIQCCGDRLVQYKHEFIDAVRLSQINTSAFASIAGISDAIQNLFYRDLFGSTAEDKRFFISQRQHQPALLKHVQEIFNQSRRQFETIRQIRDIHRTESLTEIAADQKQQLQGKLLPPCRAPRLAPREVLAGYSRRLEGDAPQDVALRNLDAVEPDAVRARTAAEFDAAADAVQEIVASTTVAGTSAQARRVSGHAPMEKQATSARLVTLAQKVAGELGFSVADAATGGASDANTTSQRVSIGDCANCRQ